MSYPVGAGFVAGDEVPGRSTPPNQGPEGLWCVGDDPLVGIVLAWMQDGYCHGVLVHVEAKVRSIVHGPSTSVCGSSRGPFARDP